MVSDDKKKNIETTLKLSKETKKRLDGLKEHRRETYDDLLNKIVDIINITIRNPVAGARIFKNIKRKKLKTENKKPAQYIQESLEEPEDSGEI